MTDRSPDAESSVLEIVHIRCSEATYRRAEAALRELLAGPGGPRARLVRSVELPHELALHLHTAPDPGRETAASDLGLRPAAATPGLEWFAPIFYLKLFVAHLPHEAPLSA
ncbi:MAG: hypothetical protein AAGM22_30400 [Acidobacteriota bacterium]